MTGTAPRRALLRWGLMSASALVIAALGIAFVGPGDALLGSWLLAFIVLSGFGIGGLALLMIGHLLGEDWLVPVRAELESAALTIPLVGLLALPLALRLDDLFPWAAVSGAELPEPRAAYFAPSFFLARGVVYLVAWTALALWLARAGRHRRAGAVGLVLLAPTLTLAATDWVMSRDPLFWSSFFGFAFALSQLVAALAGAIFVSLVRFEHPTAERMRALERALLSLALLTSWAWFVQFLIVWNANLPHEAAWYLARRDWHGLLFGVALPALALAVAVLVRRGVGRLSMLLGSALLLVHHLAFMTYLVRPGAAEASVSWGGILAWCGLAAVWLVWFAAGLRAHDRGGDRGGERGRSATGHAGAPRERTT